MFIVHEFRVPGLGLGAGKSADPSPRLIRGLAALFEKGSAQRWAKPGWTAWWLSEGLAEGGFCSSTSSSCPSWALLHGASCPEACRVPHRQPEMPPASPACFPGFIFQSGGFTKIYAIKSKISATCHMGKTCFSPARGRVTV